MRPRFVPMLAAVVVAAASCTPGPISNPLSAPAPMNAPKSLDKDPSSGAVEAARKQFLGAWDLVALEAVPEGGGERKPIIATGTLVYDEFGNLTIDARTTDPNAPAAAREMSNLAFKGRAVIDVPRSELKMMALTGNVDPEEVLSPDRRRRYAFDGDLLVLSSFDAQGNVTAISTWRRKP